MTFQDVITDRMAIGLMIGLAIGLFLWFLLFISWWKKGREVKRYRKMLDDKSKMEKEHLELYRTDKSRLETENTKLSETNDNLRDKVSQMKKSGETIKARDVEIFSRAEQKLMKSSATFAIAWEDAKNSAALELEEEEAGKRKSESFFSRFMPSRNGAVAKTSKTAS